MRSASPTGRRLQFHALALRTGEIRKQRSQQTDEREIGADVEDELDALAVGKCTENGGADATQAEGEPEEEAGHGADFAGDELLGVNENGGEGRGEDEADDRAQDGAPEEVCVREGEGERRDAEDRDPDDSFASDAVPNGAAEKGAGGNGGQEDKEMQLGVLHGEAEFLDEQKRVVAAHARQIEILRENEHDEDAEGERDAFPR